MTHTWILDVLTDLKDYARKNELTALADQLDDTQFVAATELASQADQPVMPKARELAPDVALCYAEPFGRAV